MRTEIERGTGGEFATPARDFPHVKIRYGAALASVVRLWREEASLRRATVVQAALFASFTAFWTILALHLQEPGFRLGADVAGLFGVIGVVGVVAAPVAGRIADRRGPALVIIAGAFLALSSWLLLAFRGTVPELALGVMVLDFGVHSAFVSNQHVVFSRHPDARNRLNTVFMTGMFLGGAVGSVVANFAWGLGGWPAVCCVGVFFTIASLLVAIRGWYYGISGKPACTGDAS